MSRDAGQKVCDDVNIWSQLNTLSSHELCFVRQSWEMSRFCPPVSGEFLFTDICVSASSALGRGKVSSHHSFHPPLLSTLACFNSSAFYPLCRQLSPMLRHCYSGQSILSKLHYWPNHPINIFSFLMIINKNDDDFGTWHPYKMRESCLCKCCCFFLSLALSL